LISVLDKYILQNILNESLISSINFSSYNKFQHNFLKSAKFVSIFGEGIFNQVFNQSDFRLNMIKVDDYGKKYTGEWLLDIAITQNTDGFRKKIILAVESESDTSIKSFNDDFAKLIHIKAQNYIYLNGINHSSTQGMENYISNRLEYAESLLNANEFPIFFIAFWPSPKKVKNSESIWNSILDGKYLHLNKVFLYEYISGKFQKVLKVNA
jgi:hypothetical protein